MERRRNVDVIREEAGGLKNRRSERRCDTQAQVGRMHKNARRGEGGRAGTTEFGVGKKTPRDWRVEQVEGCVGSGRGRWRSAGKRLQDGASG